MFEHNSTKDILIGVMAVAMLVVGIFVAKQMFGMGIRESNQPEGIPVATTTALQFKSRADLDVLLRTKSSEAQMVRAFMDWKTAQVSSSTTRP